MTGIEMVESMWRKGKTPVIREKQEKGTDARRLSLFPKVRMIVFLSAFDHRSSSF